MRRILVASVLAVSALATSAQAGLVNFSYTQTDSATGAGTIAPFSFMGHNFLATPLSATVFNPNPGSTPVGFVGSIDAFSGNSNEPNESVALLFSGTVTAMSDDGFLIDIPLRFVPKQTQAPDVSDYTWSIPFGDSIANGVDTVISPNPRMALWFSRDDVIDNAETAATFQRYTQLNTQAFAAGQNNYTNTNTTTTAIKDAMDSGDPQGADAVGRDLAFYFGWRDQGVLSSGTILVDDFAVGGLLNTDETTLRAIPEPSSALLALTGSILLLRRRRR